MIRANPDLPLLRRPTGNPEEPVLCGLMFELRGRRRQDARPGLAKMYTVLPAGPGGLPLALRLSEGLGFNTVALEEFSR